MRISAPAARANCETLREPVILGGLRKIAAKRPSAGSLLKENPRHPSLQLKKIDRFWSARVGSRYRALAVEVDAGLLWFWIGSHADYEARI